MTGALGPCAECGTEVPVDDLIEHRSYLYCPSCAPRSLVPPMPTILGFAAAAYAVPLCFGWRVKTVTTDHSSSTTTNLRFLVLSHESTSSYSESETGVVDSQPVTSSINYVGLVFGPIVVILSLIAVVEGIVRGRYKGALAAALFVFLGLTACCMW